MKDQKTKEKFIELRARGFSFDRIAKELRVSKQTLIVWSKELELEIANLKAIELEALQEKYYLLKQKRIELFGEKLKALKNELDKRNLEEISTKDLFGLLEKYGKLLKEESIELEFQKRDSGDLDSMLPEITGFTTVSSWRP